MFIRKAILLSSFLLLVFTNKPPIIHAQELTPLEILIEEALKNNPEIKSAYHRWKSSEYLIKTAKNLPDPNFTYGFLGENIETRVGPQEQKFGVSQKLPFMGKLKTKGTIKEKEAEILEKNYEATKEEVIKDVKLAYYDMYWIDKSLEVIEEEKSILEDIDSGLQRKYESRLSSQQNVIKIQIEISKMIEKLSLMRQTRQSLASKINRILNRQIDTVIEPAELITTEDFHYTLEDILSKAKESRQELRAVTLEIEQLEFEKSLAKMEYWPDLTLGYEYIQIGGGQTTSFEDGKDAWMGMVSVNVPIWFTKITNDIKAKEEKLAAAKEKQKSIENSVIYDTQDLYFKITAYKEILTLYETALIPQTQHAFEATQPGFETGSVSFMDWLDTERTYLHTRLAYHKSLTDYYKSITLLERVIGTQLGGHHE